MVTVASTVGFEISRRDREIVGLALGKLSGLGFDFGDALRALREATEELIPDGRVYFLGTSGASRVGGAAAGPIIGSLISGVGVVESATGIELVRIERGSGAVRTLGRFGR